MLKPLNAWITANCGKFLRDRNTRPFCLPPEKPVCMSRSNRTGHGKMDWFEIGKRVNQAVFGHPAYLASMQSTSCEMPGWMKHKLESRLLKEVLAP